MHDTHTCSYHCKRLKCIEAQRDELRDKMDKLIAEAVAAEREAIIAKNAPELEKVNAYIRELEDQIRVRGEK